MIEIGRHGQIRILMIIIAIQIVFGAALLSGCTNYGAMGRENQAREKLLYEDRMANETGDRFAHGAVAYVLEHKIYNSVNVTVPAHTVRVAGGKKIGEKVHEYWQENRSVGIGPGSAKDPNYVSSIYEYGYVVGFSNMNPQGTMLNHTVYIKLKIQYVGVDHGDAAGYTVTEATLDGAYDLVNMRSLGGANADINAIMIGLYNKIEINQ